MKKNPAWVAILGLVIFSTTCIMAGLSQILNFAFPVATFGIGILFYRRYPILYIGFTWWIWFLTPLIRRLVDYHSNFTDPSPILLAPYLTTMASLITVWKYLPKVYDKQGLPFVLALIGVIYGLFVGLIYRQTVQVFISLLEWLIPIAFGFHVFFNSARYPEFRNSFKQSFLWGIIIMGVYGILQYMIAPDWDRYWLLSTEMESAGMPEPMGIRVWSTMNSPGSFAIVMMSGLLLLFEGKGNLYFLAALPGYLSFLLSAVRSAWGGWFIGLITLAIFVRSHIQIRIILTLTVMLLLILPLATLEPFSPMISDRLETFSNIENDHSAQARQEIYGNLFAEAISSLFGEGIGSPTYDSGILAMLFSLGWTGTVFYMGGLMILVYSFLNISHQSDTFLYIVRAILFGILSQLFLGVVMLGIGGMILWGFLGLGLASQSYKKHLKNQDYPP